MTPMSEQSNVDTTAKDTGKTEVTDKTPPDMSNILSHIKQLEVTKQDLEKALKEANERNSKLRLLLHNLDAYVLVFRAFATQFFQRR